MRREICLNQQTESYQAIGRLAVALVLVQLARGDSVAAEKAFKEWGNCCDANEVQTLEMLLQVCSCFLSIMMNRLGGFVLNKYGYRHMMMKIRIQRKELLHRRSSSTWTLSTHDWRVICSCLAEFPLHQKLM